MAAMFPTRPKMERPPFAVARQSFKKRPEKAMQTAHGFFQAASPRGGSQGLASSRRSPRHDETEMRSARSGTHISHLTHFLSLQLSLHAMRHKHGSEIPMSEFSEFCEFFSGKLKIGLRDKKTTFPHCSAVWMRQSTALCFSPARST
jgi:hypothetical protein